MSVDNEDVPGCFAAAIVVAGAIAFVAMVNAAMALLAIWTVNTLFGAELAYSVWNVIAVMAAMFLARFIFCSGGKS